MALIIDQQFPSGRFHATRWNQGAFGDAYGEWPPSPWRLLRALASRWFQYVREMGQTTEIEGKKREEMLKPIIQSLAASLPAFSLPLLTWRGPALRQYQPSGIKFTKKAEIPELRKAVTSLNEDNYRAVPPDESVVWYWEDVTLEDQHEKLLDNLLERILYFGRAESFSRLRCIETLPQGRQINCKLSDRDFGNWSPVLAPVPEYPLDLRVLLAATDGRELKGRSIPPGTAWFYAHVPPQPLRVPKATARVRYPTDLNCVQFTVGGRIYPPLRRWLKLTERYRTRVIKHLAEIIAPDSEGRYERLTHEQRETLALISGKDGDGRPLQGHRHAFFLLWPDEDSKPTRLVVWRPTPFTEDELKALLKAAEWPIAWDAGSPDWKLRVVPLPFETSAPTGLLSESRFWRSATPFVPPAERHRFRKNGRERPREAPEQILLKQLRLAGLPTPQTVTSDECEQKEWVSIHETRSRRVQRQQMRTGWSRPGFQLSIAFASPIAGPIVLGESCHFGFGLFASHDSDDQQNR